MSPSEVDSAPLYGRSTIMALYALLVLLAALAVGLLAGRVSSWLLASVLFLWLGVGGLALNRLARRRRQSRPAWRDVMPCYLSIQDRDLRIVESNEALDRDFGHSLGEHCYRVYKQAEAPCSGCPVLRTFEDGKTHTGEQMVTTRDGARAEVMVTSAPLVDEGGNVTAVMEMSTNITAVKALQRELERSRSQYKLFFDLVPCYISIQDRRYIIVESNALFRRDFGQHNGSPCYTVYKGLDAPCPNCIVQRSFQDGEVHSTEETVTTQQGRQVKLIVYSMPLFEQTGEVIRVMEVATDITEVKALQHELTLIGRAVAGLAHRIKNILMGLEGGLFVVSEALEANDSASVDQGWEMITRNVAKVSNIVKDLLYCSKKRIPRFDEMAAEEIAQEVYQLYRGRTEREGIELRLEVGPPWRRLLAPEGIHSLMANLIANAIDACRFDPSETKEKHAITLRCHSNGREGTVIEVSDNGVGIPNDVGGRIFEDFFSTKGTEGTGLGLLVIRNVVDEHGGAITFDSQPGLGTTFKVVIPPTLPPVELTPVRRTDEQESSGNR